MTNIVPYQHYQGDPGSGNLQVAIVQWVGRGWQVEAQTPTQAVLVSRSPCNHVVHGLLLAANFFIGGSIATCLVWTVIVPLVWLVVMIVQGVAWAVASKGSETRKVLTMDPYGRLHVS
jgi:hypothetical protein